MAQTTYSTSYTIAEHGQLANISFKHVDSGFNETGSAIPFGVALIQGTAYNQFKTPSALSDKIVGVALRSDVWNNQSLDDIDGITDDGPVNVLRYGDIYVLPEETVTPGDPVYVRITAGATEQAGAFRKDSDSGDAVKVNGLTWVKGGTTSSPAILRVRLDEANESGDKIVVRVEHAQVTADTTIPMVLFVPANKVFVLDSAYVNNETGLAEDTTNYFTYKVLNGATVMASLNTKTGEGGSLAASTPTAITNGTLANRTVVGGASGAEITVSLDEDGTATLPAGSVIIEGRLI